MRGAHGALPAQRRKCSSLFYFPVRYMQRKHLFIIKTRSRRVLFSLVEISAILGFGFKGTIPIKHIFLLVIESLCLK